MPVLDSIFQKMEKLLKAEFWSILKTSWGRFFVCLLCKINKIVFQTLSKRLSVSIVHNFYSFEENRLKFDWSFGDGQIQNNSFLDYEEISYPNGGLYNVTCTISSIVTGNSVIIWETIEIFFPISGLNINFDDVALGPNARIPFNVEVEQGKLLHKLCNINYHKVLYRYYLKIFKFYLENNL